MAYTCFLCSLEWYFTENLQEKRIGNFKTLAYILPLVSHKCSIFKAFFINQQTLYISQQSLSEQMKRLEELYGTTLFIRRPRFALTPAGEALLDTALRIRLLEQSLNSCLEDIKDNGIGSLRFGIHASRAEIIMPATITRFHNLYPRVTIDILHNDTLAFERKLQNGELDMFLGVDPHRYPDFEYTYLTNEPVCVVISEQLLLRAFGEKGIYKKKLTPQEVASLPLIANPESSNLRQKQAEFFNLHDLHPLFLVSIADYKTQLFCAKNNMGACFCPQLFIQKAAELNAAHPENPLRSLTVEGFNEFFSLALVTHKFGYQKQYLSDFKQILQEELIYNQKEAQEV